MPQLNKVTVSLLKVEKVVKAPKNPVIKRHLKLFDKSNLSIISVKIPIKKPPETFTKRVETGINEDKFANLFDTKYLKTAPKAPPRATYIKLISPHCKKLINI